MKFKENQGFSLIEMMVVVAIMGVLSVVAVPKFQVFKAKAYRSELTGTLSEIHTLEQAYQIDKDTYTMNLDLIGYVAKDINKRVYTFTGSAADAFTFTVAGQKIARTKFLSSCANPGDDATINEVKAITITVDGLAGC